MATKLSTEASKNLTKVEKAWYKQPSKEEIEAGVESYIPNLKVSKLMETRAQDNGIFIQIFQRFHVSSKSNILDLFEMFKEIETQIGPKGNEDYQHTASVMCVNPFANFNGKNVFSVFDGQHRTIFFVFLMLSLLKLSKKTEKNLFKRIIKLVFKKSILKNDNFILKYANENIRKELNLFLESFFDYLNTDSRSSFATYVDETNSFSKSFFIIDQEAKKLVGQMKNVESFFNRFNERINVILRYLQPNENEIVIFLYENKERIPFMEFEAVKMITTNMLGPEEERLAYAENFNDLLEWIKENSESSLNATDIAHCMRLAFMDMENFKKHHISITVKSDREKKLSEVIRRELTQKFKEDPKQSDIFLDKLKKYVSIIIALKTGFVPELDNRNISPEVQNVVSLYSFVYNKADTSGQRFSYIAAPILYNLLFTNKIEFRHGKRSNINEAYADFIKPVVHFAELTFAEFVTNGSNVFKPYEDAFDSSFVELISYYAEDKHLTGEFDILKKELSLKKIEKNTLLKNIKVKNNWREIHSSDNIRTLIMFLFEYYYMLKENMPMSELFVNLTSLSTNISIDHIIPKEFKILLENEEKDKDLFLSIQDAWYLTCPIESNLNSKASNHNVDKRISLYQKESNFYGFERFKGFKDIYELEEKKEEIKNKLISLIEESISIL